MYETNSFSPGTAGLADFQARVFVDGEQCFSVGGGRDEFAGALSVAGPAGAQLIPTTLTIGAAGPTVTAPAYAALRDRLLRGLAPLVGSVDGVYLRLHGAMVAQGCDDPEGDIIAAVREMFGGSVPVAVSLDLHTHFTPALAAGTDLIAGFRTSPHVDYFDTGARAVSLLLAALRGANPVLRFRSVPMMAAAESHDNNSGPLVQVFQRMHHIAAEPGVLDASMFLTQPWLDVPGLGWTAVVVTDGDPDLAQRRADELAGMLWERRELTLVRKTPVADAIADIRARPGAGRPIVVSDGADSPTAGAKSDGNTLLRALIEDPVPGPVLLTVTDAPAAQACHAAGVGAQLTVPVGGTLAPAFFQPVTVTGQVVTLCDGEFTSRYPNQPAHGGPTAVLRCGSVDVVLTSLPVRLLDAELYRRVGLDVGSAAVVQVKSSGGFRATYQPLADRIIELDTRGPADHELTRLPYARISRPCWPWDIDTPWRAGSAGPLGLSPTVTGR
jgi:microcystin degradation protein MlrC